MLEYQNATFALMRTCMHIYSHRTLGQVGAVARGTLQNLVDSISGLVKSVGFRVLIVPRACKNCLTFGTVYGGSLVCWTFPIEPRKAATVKH